MITESLAVYSAQPDQHERMLPLRAEWQTINGSVPVTIIAYSLGATIAYCIIGLGDVLEPGNYSATWLLCRQLRYP